MFHILFQKICETVYYQKSLHRSTWNFTSLFYSSKSSDRRKGFYLKPGILIVFHQKLMFTLVCSYFLKKKLISLYSNFNKGFFKSFIGLLALHVIYISLFCLKIVCMNRYRNYTKRNTYRCACISYSNL